MPCRINMLLICVTIIGMLVTKTGGTLSSSSTAAVGNKVQKYRGSGQVLGLWWTDKKVLNESPDITTQPSLEKAADSEDVTFKLDLVKKIRYSMLTMKGDFMDPTGSSVRYDLIRASPKFHEYLDLVRQLEFIDMSKMTVKERKAFLVNIYNSLVIHALVEGLLQKFPGGSLSRLQLYASASYNIGGEIYSLNEIENGLLRGNRMSAVPFTRLPFNLDNNKKKQLMLECDPRIHFALNCGAVSCPPIAVYEADTLDEDLDMATEGFLEGNTFINTDESVISTSMLFEWYKEDFGGSNEKIIDWIKDRSPQKLSESISKLPKPTLKFSTYNWDLNDK